MGACSGSCDSEIFSMQAPTIHLARSTTYHYYYRGDLTTNTVDAKWLGTVPPVFPVRYIRNNNVWDARLTRSKVTQVGCYVTPTPVAVEVVSAFVLVANSCTLPHRRRQSLLSWRSTAGTICGRIWIGNLGNCSWYSPGFAYTCLLLTLNASYRWDFKATRSPPKYGS